MMHSIKVNSIDELNEGGEPEEFDELQGKKEENNEDAEDNGEGESSECDGEHDSNDSEGKQEVRSEYDLGDEWIFGMLCPEDVGKKPQDLGSYGDDHSQGQESDQDEDK